MKPLNGKVALVAGATRGAGRGIAIELGAAGATVYVTGRTTRTQRSEYNRPETIEEAAELVSKAGAEELRFKSIIQIPNRFGHSSLALRMNREIGHPGQRCLGWRIFDTVECARVGALPGTRASHAPACD